jgi:hypothetical protein
MNREGEKIEEGRRKLGKNQVFRLFCAFFAFAVNYSYGVYPACRRRTAGIFFDLADFGYFKIVKGGA